MIKLDGVQDNTLQTLILLQDLPIAIYPTGSRLFGTARADSDFDFYALFTPFAEEWLKNHHFFYLTPPPGGWDKNTHAIYRKGHIDVALLFSVAARSIVEGELKANPTYLKCLKSTKFSSEARRDFWNGFYEQFVGTSLDFRRVRRGDNAETPEISATEVTTT